MRYTLRMGKSVTKKESPSPPKLVCECCGQTFTVKKRYSSGRCRHRAFERRKRERKVNV